MDNVTHAIAGAVTAEVLIHLRRRLGASAARETGGADPSDAGDASAAIPPPAPPPGLPAATFAGAAWAVSMLGHNLPDADSLYTRITGGVLGYLLHHRGHTHTLALAPVVALLSYAIVAAWLRWRGHVPSRSDRRWLLLVAALGPVGHIALDASNDYGVHPFWPFDDAWYYGDTIFIVEPLFWACTLPILVAASTWRPGRVIWAGLLVLGVSLTWGVDLVPWPSAVATTVVAAASIAVAARASSLARVTFAFAGSLAVFVLFAMCSRAAAANVRAVLARHHPDWETLDVTRSPLPATPLCWQAVAVQRSRDGLRYALRRAEASAWPGLVTAAECARPSHGTTAPLRVGDVPDDAVLVEGQLEVPIAGLQERARRCDVYAYLRWSRAPFFATAPGVDESGAFVIGDLRYDRSPAIEFAEQLLPRDVARCPAHVPSWRPPRADLLAP